MLRAERKTTPSTLAAITEANTIFHQNNNYYHTTLSAGEVHGNSAFVNMSVHEKIQPLELMSTDHPWGGVDASSYQEWMASIQQQYHAMGKTAPSWACKENANTVGLKHGVKGSLSRRQDTRVDGMRDIKDGLQKIIDKYAAKTQERDAELVEENKSRRPSYSPAQIRRLEAMFSVNRYPSVNDKLHLAETLNISVKQVSVWFQNRRCKDKRKCGSELLHRQMKAQQNRYVNILPNTAPKPLETNVDANSWKENSQNPMGGVIPMLAVPITLQSIAINATKPETIAPDTSSQIQQTVGMMEKMELGNED